MAKFPKRLKRKRVNLIQISLPSKKSIRRKFILQALEIVRLKFDRRLKCE